MRYCVLSVLCVIGHDCLLCILLLYEHLYEHSFASIPQAFRFSFCFCPPHPPLCPSLSARGKKMANRNVEIYSQLREAAKQIIARVAGRLSGTVGRSGLMDPAVTRLERAAVVANTPITFRPRELLGVSSAFGRLHV